MSNNKFNFDRYDCSCYEEEEYYETPLEKFYGNHPILAWSLIIICSTIAAKFLILYIWKLFKSIIYQIVFTVTKAIKDGKS